MMSSEIEEEALTDDYIGARYIKSQTASAVPNRISERKNQSSKNEKHESSVLERRWTSQDAEKADREVWKAWTEAMKRKWTRWRSQRL
jgi:uncharacterized membrane protein YheB (UPF0754 family)